MPKPKGSKKAKKKEKEIDTDDSFSVSIEVAGKTFKGNGPTILEALKAVENSSFDKGIGRIQVERLGKVSKIPIKIPYLRLQRLFTKKYEMELFAKRLNTLY